MPSFQPLRALEKAIPWIWHPEQVLSAEPGGQKLYDFTMWLANHVRQQERPYHDAVNSLFKKHKIASDEDGGKFFQLLEWPTYMKRNPSIEELKQFSPNVRAAVREHLGTITDPIWKTVKAGDPSVGYIPGYITHYAPAIKRTLMEEQKRLSSQLSSLRDVNDSAATFARRRMEEQLEHINYRLGRLDKIAKESNIDAILTPQRYGILQKGGYAAPINEQRRMMRQLGIERGYEEIMHEYVSGAFRKVYLDRLMPAVKIFFDPKSKHYISDPALRQFAYDYVQAQRGTLGTKSKINFSSALRSLFPRADDVRILRRTVDEITRFQYLAKIGISPRYPLVHATKSLLTTYPIVGGKIFWEAFKDAFKLDTWKKADRAGFIFKPTVSRSVSESYGRDWMERRTPWQRILETITAPATFSERFDRVVTFAAGEHKARQLGLTGRKAEEYIQNLTDTTQFRYFREAMPLIVSGSALGRVIYQFKTFTANYVNFMTKLYRKSRAGDKEAKTQFIRALGTFAVLAGTTHIPLWDTVRSQLLRHAGVDIGSFNPTEWATEQLGIVPGIDPRFFMHGIVSDVYSILGPTLGPPTQLYFDIQKDPDRAWEHLGDFLNKVSAPATSFLKPLREHGEALIRTPSHPEGKAIGVRSPWEVVSLRPRIESVRHRYIEEVADAMVGGRNDLVQKRIEEARRAGVYVNQDFMGRVNALVSKRKKSIWR
jgi:hypothetical protein